MFSKQISQIIGWIELHPKIFMVFLGATGWALRVMVVCLHPEPDHYIASDTISYYENALSILHIGEARFKVFPVGFSLILIPLIALKADLWTIGHIIEPAVGAMAGVLVFILARKMQNIRAGIAAGMICAFHPTLLNCSSQILTEDWTIMFTLAALVILSNNSWHRCFVAGIIMGVACTVRSPCLALVAAIAIWWIIARGRKGLLLSIPFCVGAFLPILFVSIFLSYSQHRLILLTPQSDEMSRYAAVKGGWVSLKPEEKEERKSYFLFAVKQPKKFLKERFDSFITFVSPWPFGNDRSLGRKLMLAISDGLVLAFAGFAFLRVIGNVSFRPILLLPWMVLMLCVFYTLTYSIPRYRVPAIPLLVTFTCLALIPPRGPRQCAE